MSLGITDTQHYSDIADAIRAKNGSANTYMPSEMAAAISAIPSGGGGGPQIIGGDYYNNHPMIDFGNNAMFTQLAGTSAFGYLAVPTYNIGIATSSISSMRFFVKFQITTTGKTSTIIGPDSSGVVPTIGLNTSNQVTFTKDSDTFTLSYTLTANTWYYAEVTWVKDTGIMTGTLYDENKTQLATNQMTSSGTSSTSKWITVGGQTSPSSRRLFGRIDYNELIVETNGTPMWSVN